MDAKTLSFGKNGEEPRVAFENIDANELYPCVMFYSTNPGEKVKITDMKVQGTQKDLLPGEPNLAPLYTILTESYTVLIRKLHNSVTWTEDINEGLLLRLSKIEMFFPTVESHNIDVDVNSIDENIRSEIKVNELCNTVWPALIVIGGLDRGLRMGALCKHKTTGKEAIVLGILKKGITTVNVQWEHDGVVSDVSISNLEYIEPNPFSTEKMFGLNSNILLQLSRLSGITKEISFPKFELTDGEKELLNKKSKRSFYSDASSNSETQMQKQMTSELPRSVETLTNEMVSSIMGEVRRISTEKFIGSHSDSNTSSAIENQKKIEDRYMETKLLEKKMLDLECEHLKLTFLQFAALKVLGIFVTSPLFKEQAFLNKLGKQEDRESLKIIMQAIVSKSIEQCKLRNIITLSDIERAQTILHYSYAKSLIQKDQSSSNNKITVENGSTNNISNSFLSNSASGSSRSDISNAKPGGAVQRQPSNFQSQVSAFFDESVDNFLGKFKF